MITLKQLTVCWWNRDFTSGRCSGSLYFRCERIPVMVIRDPLLPPNTPALPWAMMEMPRSDSPWGRSSSILLFRLSYSSASLLHSCLSTLIPALTRPSSTRLASSAAPRLFSGLYSINPNLLACLCWYGIKYWSVRLNSIWMSLTLSGCFTISSWTMRCLSGTEKM